MDLGLGIIYVQKNYHCQELHVLKSTIFLFLSISNIILARLHA